MTTDKVHSLWLVEEGYVKRYQITNTGDKSIQSIYAPGEVFSLTHVFRVLLHKEIYQGPEEFYYEAMDKSTLYELDEALLIETGVKNPELYRELLLIAGERFLSNIQHLENLSLHDSYHRVAHSILFYSRKSSHKGKNNYIHIDVPLTQQDLADVLSLTRETVSACMARLKKEKILASGNRGIIVKDIDRLAEIAYS